MGVPLGAPAALNRVLIQFNIGALEVWDEEMPVAGEEWEHAGDVYDVKDVDVNRRGGVTVAVA